MLWNAPLVHSKCCNTFHTPLFSGTYVPLCVSGIRVSEVCVIKGLNVYKKLRDFSLFFSSPDHDDEFVSESYQASTEDINEANASMKRLGVTGKKFKNWSILV